MKNLLFAVYIFSVLYCYLQLNTLIDRCVTSFKEKHPDLPMDKSVSWNGVKLTVELFIISAIPLANLWLGYFCATQNDSVVHEIINNVEVNNWQEIKKFEDAADEFDFEHIEDDECTENE